MKRVVFNIEEDVYLLIRNKRILKEWIGMVLLEYQIKDYCLNFVFCSEDTILRINKKHLDHNYFTDIITFDLSEKKGTIESDLFISVNTVLSNSHKFKTIFDQEMSRTIIHGVLHLLGFGDKSIKQIETIRGLENDCLAKLFHVKRSFFTTTGVSRETI